MSNGGSQKKLGHGGTDGKAPKTGQGYENAIKMFDQFVDKAIAENIGIGPLKLFKKYQMLTAEELANQQIFQEFAYFLGKDAIKNIKAQIHKGEAVSEDHNGDPLAVSTAQQYFSNFLNAAANRFSDHVFFKEILDVPRGESLPWV